MEVLRELATTNGKKIVLFLSMFVPIDNMVTPYFVVII